MSDFFADVSVSILDAPAALFDVSHQLESGDEGFSVVATVTNTSALPIDAAVRLSVSIDAPHAYPLIPGAFYGENRPQANTRVFPRFQVGVSAPADHQRQVSDEWHFRVDRAAAPVVFMWADEGAPGIALEVDQSGALGDQAIGFRIRDGRASLDVTAPMREFPVRYVGSDIPDAPEVRLATFAPGEPVHITALVHRLSADRHDYDRVLRARHARLNIQAVTPSIGLDEAARTAAYGLLHWHYDPDPGVLLETVGFDREVTGRDGKSVDRQAMHVGWVSGIPWASAMLQHASRVGDDRTAAAAKSVIDFCTSDLSPSGTFWGVWYRDRGWRSSWNPRPHTLHARTLGEATDFLLRAVTWHDAPRWLSAALSNLDAVVGRQRADGNLGALHDAMTGEVLSWDGSAALAWVPALVRGSPHGDRYLDAAVRAGEYYAHCVEAEYLNGAPEDVDLAPTSEDGYVAVMAYMALFRATGTERWLDLARRAAEWTFTFRYDYNVAFGPLTPLGRYGYRTVGADQASSSNQHLHAYGLICTQELLEMSELTGDPSYGQRARETLACFRQLVPVSDGDFNAYRGMITERYYQTDCFQPKGMVLTLSHAWSAGVLLLGCEQAIAHGLDSGTATA